MKILNLDIGVSNIAVFFILFFIIIFVLLLLFFFLYYISKIKKSMKIEIIEERGGGLFKYPAKLLIKKEGVTREFYLWKLFGKGEKVFVDEKLLFNTPKGVSGFFKYEKGALVPVAIDVKSKDVKVLPMDIRNWQCMEQTKKFQLLMKKGFWEKYGWQITAIAVMVIALVAIALVIKFASDNVSKIMEQGKSVIDVCKQTIPSATG